MKQSKCEKLMFTDALTTIDCNCRHENRIQNIVKNSFLEIKFTTPHKPSTFFNDLFALW